MCAVRAQVNATRADLGVERAGTSDQAASSASLSTQWFVDLVFGAGDEGTVLTCTFGPTEIDAAWAGIALLTRTLTPKTAMNARRRVLDMHLLTF